MSETLVTVNGVSKKFCRDLKSSLRYGLQDIRDELMGRSSSNRIHLRNQEFWAVNDVSFEVKRGQCIGLIGRNGAGKSTLLKMLNGLVKPDAGRIEMRGRVGALIELGAGFNPILTGRENIYVNGSVLGLTKLEIKRRLDSIIDFSEIGEFLDTPVQYYSSGMKIRLGFAIAAQLEPDILLVDEVLAVGDMGFVLKCFNQMDRLLANSAIILVSHNIPQIARMCTNLLVLKNGRCIHNSDDVAAGIATYYSQFGERLGTFQGNGKAEIIGVKLMSRGETSRSDEIFAVSYGSELTIVVELWCHEAISKPNLYLAFHDREQRNFAEINNFRRSIKYSRVEGRVLCSVFIPSIQFSQGYYSVSIGFAEEGESGRQVIFRYQSAVYFNVIGEVTGWAPLQLAPEWKMDLLKLED